MQLTPEEITALREQAGMTRQGFSLALGMQEDAVRAWESGRRRPNAAACLGIALYVKLRETAEGRALLIEAGAL